MTVTERYLQNNRGYRINEGHAPLPGRPSSGVAVVACMDARLNIYAILGAKEGEVHILRNAGGVVTDDTIRSLIISQRLLGTREIILIHHTDCGMLNFRDDEFREAIAAEVGQKPLEPFHAFDSLEDDVLDGIARIRANPFLPHREVRGFICDIESGLLNEVVAN